MLKTVMIKTSLIALAVSISLSAHAIADAPKNINVPPGDLVTALETIARQAEVELLFNPDQLRGLSTSGMTGTMTFQEAVRKLLEGTTLQLRTDASNGAMMIGPTPVGDGVESPAQPPSPVTRNSSADDDSKSGSFWSRFRLAQATTTSASGGEEPREGASTADQAPNLQKRAVQLEEIMVTGTRISGSPQAAPVLTVTRMELEQSGQSQIGDLVRALPQNFGGGQSPVLQPLPTGGGNETNASSVNLRGLGSDATLVLLNGHRVAGNGSFGAPDISAIPLAAIERVEIVTDGASALYGSDAIAGVVNFVLRDNYDGAEMSGRLGYAAQGGGYEQAYNAMAGRAWRTGHLLVGIETLDQDAILANQRSFTATAGPLNTLLPSQRRVSLFATAHQDLSSWATVRFDGLYTERGADLTFEDGPGPDAFASFTATDTTSYLLAPSVDFHLDGDWTVSLDGTLGCGTNDLDGTYNVGGGFQTAIRNESKSAELNATGTLLPLPSGPLRVAIGMGRRDESNVLRDRGSPDRIGNRQIDYLFGELLVPVVRPSDTRVGLHRLELSLAARYENYSDFGDQASPRVGVVYEPLADLRVRGTWGESFKAAPFPRMYDPRNVQLWDASILGSATPGVAMFVFGGNPDLEPETSTSRTLGFDWSPTRISGLNVSVTYFNVDYRDRIVQPFSSIGTVLSDPASEPFLIRNPSAAEQAAAIAQASRFSSLIPTPYDPTTVIALVQGAYLNALEQTIEGLDVSVSKTFDLRHGEFDIHLNGSWLDLAQQNLPTLPIVTLSGRAFYPTETRLRGGATWRGDRLSATATVNYQSGSTDWVLASPADISSWTTIDLNFAYRFPDWSGDLDGLDVSLGVLNALDKDPPFVAGAGSALQGMNFDSANASPVGRFVALTLRQRF